jgi:carboxylesterase type B
MHPISLYTLIFVSVIKVNALAQAIDTLHNITYIGTIQSGIQRFLNIPYGKDTSGSRRFAAPEPFIQVPDTIFDATTPSPACPQPIDGDFPWNSNATYQSEDCLKLDIARPPLVPNGSKLPVMVWIYGGGLFDGQISERTTTGLGLVQQSMENELPVLFVAINYRVNIFGFADSDALRSSKSLNAGLRDQRLALEWVKENIEYFGGNPDRVTIFGQSSGGTYTLHVSADRPPY